jgi:AraC-like DNA-binding protein
MNKWSFSDPLSRALSRVCFPAWKSGGFSLKEPWGTSLPAGLVALYVMLSGKSYFKIDGCSNWLQMEAGDLLFITSGAAHCFANDPATPLVSAEEFERMQVRPIAPYREENTATRMLYAHVSLTILGDNPFSAIFSPIIHRQQKIAADNSYVTALLNLIKEIQSSPVAGGQAIVGKLLQTLMVEVLRTDAAAKFRLAQSSGATWQSNWLLAAMDSVIGPAIASIHQAPGNPWTVRDLASSVKLSKSAFAERFRELVGQTPLQYITEVRMHKAAELLQNSELSVAEIANATGYESASSFSNTFKRWHGESPLAIRKATTSPFAATAEMPIVPAARSPALAAEPTI